MITDINSEDRLVQRAFADHLRDVLGWESIYAFNEETFGPTGTLGRSSEREVILVRDLRAALKRLNPGLPEPAIEQAIEKLIRVDFARSLVQHNREFYGYIRNGVPVEWRDATGETQYARAQVIDFRNRTGPDGKPNNRFLAVRELKIQGLRVPHYNRRADLVCFINGIPLAFIELKAVYLNMRAGYDNNLTDYLSDTSRLPQPALRHQLAARPNVVSNSSTSSQRIFCTRLPRTLRSDWARISTSLPLTNRMWRTPSPQRAPGSPRPRPAMRSMNRGRASRRT